MTRGSNGDKSNFPGFVTAENFPKYVLEKSSKKIKTERDITDGVKETKKSDTNEFLKKMEDI